MVAIGLGAFALAVGVDLLVGGKKGGSGWLDIPGLFALLGFVGSLLLFWGAKGLGHLLQRPRGDEGEGDT
jgi:hypothetical protein